MIKYISFFIILFLGCQQNWSIKEQKDFKTRCVKYKPNKYNLEDYNLFCDCMLKEFMKLKLSYSQFLKTDSNSLETEEILKSCIENP